MEKPQSPTKWFKLLKGHLVTKLIVFLTEEVSNCRGFFFCLGHFSPSFQNPMLCINFELLYMEVSSECISVVCQCKSFCLKGGAERLLFVFTLPQMKWTKEQKPHSVSSEQYRRSKSMWLSVWL